MKGKLIEFILISAMVACVASSRKTGITGSGDYYVIESCPDFDSSQYVLNLDLTFSQIPTSGQPCNVTISGLITKTFFMSYIEVTAKFNGVKIIDQKIEFDEVENENTQYSRTLLVPTALMPAGVISGVATGYNELGNMVQCYNYQIIVRKSQ